MLCMFEILTEYKWLAGGVAMASVLLFVVTLLVLPVIIIRLPAGYFQDNKGR